MEYSVEGRHGYKVAGTTVLKRETNGWRIEVSDEIARGKVSMLYRPRRVPIRVARPMANLEDRHPLSARE